MTPPTKRGVGIPKTSPVGLGWLSLTIRGRDAAERPRIAADLYAALDVEPRARDRGIKGYEHAVDVGSESTLGTTDKRPNEVHLTLKQSDCSWPAFAQVLDVAEQYDSWQVSRLDLNYDDADRRAELPDLIAANRRGDYVTRVDVTAPGKQRVFCDLLGNPTSIYYGSLTSERVLNVYDKDVERADVLGQPVALGTYGVRWELRLRDERAVAMVHHLRDVGSDAGLLDVFWQAVVDLVDFRAAAAAAGHHNEVRPRLSWFAQLVGDRARRGYSKAHELVDHSFRVWRLDRWARTQVAGALAELVDEHADDPLYLRRILDTGYQRLALKRARAAAVFDVAFAVPA